MSDLDSYSRSWRQSAANAVGDRTELLDELEAHLREAFERLSAAGLPSEQAWETALMLLGAWWSQGHLGRWWGWDPREIGGLCVFRWASMLWQCFRLRNLTAPLRLCIAVTGNMVVALAWFGPALLADGKIHEHAASPLGHGCGRISGAANHAGLPVPASRWHSARRASRHAVA